MYKIAVIKYYLKAKGMAAKVEATTNKMEQAGFELFSCSIMPSSKGIMIFKIRRTGNGKVSLYHCK